MTISIAATRSLTNNDVSLDGATTVTSGSGNTVYNITDYNRFSVYTVSTTVGTASITGSTITLNVPTTTAPQIILSVQKDHKNSNFVIAVGASAIVTPSITSLAEGQVNVVLSPTLSSSPFTTAPAGLATHQSSRWQVATDSNFSDIVFDSGATTVNKTSINVPSGLLAISTTYYARVQYTGSSLGTSAWSSERTFTTANTYVNTPTVTVQGGNDNVGSAPTFTTSPFSVSNGSDTHVSTDWQVIKTSDSSVVWQSLGNTVNKTSITMPDNLLTESSSYTVLVRFTGSTLGNSGYGQTDFTTTDIFFVFSPASAGLAFGGGYYAGANIRIGGLEYALVVAPKVLGGETPNVIPWKNSETLTPNTFSENDGAANTAAMLAAGGAAVHPPAAFTSSLTINGYTDWYVPSKDELEIAYRYLKPNATLNRTSPLTGQNNNSNPLGAVYSASNPARTISRAFQTNTIGGGQEAFSVEDGGYWTSTGDNASVSFAKYQRFTDGTQTTIPKSSANYRVRAFRKVLINNG